MIRSITKNIFSKRINVEFPCLAKHDSRQKALEDGPEPNYENIVSGYSETILQKPFEFILGDSIPQVKIAYESWGELNDKKDNVILLHTGLSGSSHAKSQPNNMEPGWWEKFIGPGLAIDTDKFHVICTNVIGGCYGSSGPSSVSPIDGERYATRFPIVTIFDMVRAQFQMLDQMGIQKLHASVGSSMGGMQSIAAAAMFPERVGKLITISAAARSHPYSIALRFAQRQVLMADPNWNKGFYYKGVLPHSGMKLARQIATITYRSGPEWEERFGRTRAKPEDKPALCPDFLIETYIDHQGEKFCLTYDPNSLLYVSKAMDLFDMSHPIPQIGVKPTVEEPNMDPNEAERRLIQGLSPIQMPTLVLGVQSDLLFPIWQQKEIADCLRKSGNKNVTYYELDAKYGHDTFLIDTVNVGSAIKGHLEIH
ncbi:homoserine O-acetyltransferase [Globomyces pollinis-pini]|nr:homoserine O-acetyltransferase [Globomyces pollinis-pini]